MTTSDHNVINGIAVGRSIPLRGVQRTVAQRMVESRTTTASVTAMAEADATVLLATLERLRLELPGLSITHLLIQATAQCLQRHPRLNATLVDDTIHELADINISVALSLPSDDLYVVTIYHADKKSLRDIVTELTAVRERASRGRLLVADVKGGTFTVSNYGMLRNVVWSTPVITPGQTGVLGIARVVQRMLPISPGAANVSEQDSQRGYTVRPMLPFSLTYDHRIFNGVPAGRFLDDLAEMLTSDSWVRLKGKVQ